MHSTIMTLWVKSNIEEMAWGLAKDDPAKIRQPQQNKGRWLWLKSVDRRRGESLPRLWRRPMDEMGECGKVKDQLEGHVSDRGE